MKVGFSMREMYRGAMTDLALLIGREAGPEVRRMPLAGSQEAGRLALQARLRRHGGRGREGGEVDGGGDYLKGNWVSVWRAFL